MTPLRNVAFALAVIWQILLFQGDLKTFKVICVFSCCFLLFSNFWYTAKHFALALEVEVLQYVSLGQSLLTQVVDVTQSVLGR